MTRVLVVDDDRLVADTLRLVFRANGFDAEATYSAAQGLERARAFSPQLLLTDITMPEQNGLELAEAITRELPECRILMLTAYSSNLAKAAGQNQSIGRHTKVLSKPVRPEDLLRHADDILNAA